MKTVTQKFLNDVNAGLSPAVRYMIWLKNENDDEWDITDLTDRKKLFRISWQLEGKLTAFRQGDASLTLVYQEDLWDWIQASDEIKLYVDCGFPYEKINRFRGYVDKENTEYDTSGLIHLRAIPIHRNLEKVKISEVAKPKLDPSIVKDAVSAIFTEVGVTNQNIRVLPMDTKDNKYMDNYLQVSDYGGGQTPLCPVSDTAFLQSDGIAIVLTEFSSDWDDITITELVRPDHPRWECLKIDKWRDDYFVAIFGVVEQKRFYNGANPVLAWDNVLKQIIIFKADGTILYNFQPPNYSFASIDFYPRAQMVSPLWDERTGTDYFAIGYNGILSSDTWIRHCGVRLFDMSAPTVSVRHFEYYFKMFREEYWLCGGGSGRAFVFPMKIGTYGASGQTIYALKSGEPLYWVNYTSVTSELDSFFARGAWPLGRYVLMGYQTKAWNYINNRWFEDFIPTGYTSVIEGTNTNSVDLDVPKQLITAYNQSLAKIYVKKFFNNESYGDEYIAEALREFYYKDTEGNYQLFNMQFDYGFKYWHVYNDKSVYIGIPRFYLITGSAGHICIVAPRMLPFIPLWGADEANDGILTTLEKIAQAFNCLFNFTDFDTGWFFSRQFVSDEWTISKTNAYKFQDISKDAIYEILMKWNDPQEETLIGTGDKRLTIETPYLPAHEVAVETVGQNYYDFFSTYRWLIKVKTDFMIFLDLFDYAHLWDEYSGWIFETDQEHNRYKLKMRAQLAEV